MSTAAETVNAIVGAQPLGTSSLPCPRELELFRQEDGTLPRGSIQLVRGRGRPKNAKNKRSKKIADYYVQRYGDPLDAIGQMANTPLRQLVELLIEADGGEERERRLLSAVDEAVDHIKNIRSLSGDIASQRELAENLADAINKLASAAAKISGKPGKLALDALALQMQAQFRALEYVHGKQPIAVDVRRTADVVLVAPEMLKEHNIDPVALANAIATNGLEALDPDSLQLIEGDYAEVGPATDGASE